MTLSAAHQALMDVLDDAGFPSAKAMTRVSWFNGEVKHNPSGTENHQALRMGAWVESRGSYRRLLTDTGEYVDINDRGDRIELDPKRLPLHMRPTDEEELELHSYEQSTEGIEGAEPLVVDEDFVASLSLRLDEADSRLHDEDYHTEIRHLSDYESGMYWALQAKWAMDFGRVRLASRALELATRALLFDCRAGPSCDVPSELRWKLQEHLHGQAIASVARHDDRYVAKELLARVVELDDDSERGIDAAELIKGLDLADARRATTGASPKTPKEKVDALVGLLHDQGGRHDYYSPAACMSSYPDAGRNVVGEIRDLGPDAIEPLIAHLDDHTATRMQIDAGYHYEVARVGDIAASLLSALTANDFTTPRRVEGLTTERRLALTKAKAEKWWAENRNRSPKERLLATLEGGSAMSSAGAAAKLFALEGTDAIDVVADVALKANERAQYGLISALASADSYELASDGCARSTGGSEHLDPLVATAMRRLAASGQRVASQTANEMLLSHGDPKQLDRLVTRFRTTVESGESYEVGWLASSLLRTEKPKAIDAVISALPSVKGEARRYLLNSLAENCATRDCKLSDKQRKNIAKVARAIAMTPEPPTVSSLRNSYYSEDPRFMAAVALAVANDERVEEYCCMSRLDRERFVDKTLWGTDGERGGPKARAELYPPPASKGPGEVVLTHADVPGAERKKAVETMLQRWDGRLISTGADLGGLMGELSAVSLANPGAALRLVAVHLRDGGVALYVTGTVAAEDEFSGAAGWMFNCDNNYACSDSGGGSVRDRDEALSKVTKALPNLSEVPERPSEVVFITMDYAPS